MVAWELFQRPRVRRPAPSAEPRFTTSVNGRIWLNKAALDLGRLVSGDNLELLFDKEAAMVAMRKRASRDEATFKLIPSKGGCGVVCARSLLRHIGVLGRRSRGAVLITDDMLVMDLGAGIAGLRADSESTGLRETERDRDGLIEHHNC